MKHTARAPFLLEKLRGQSDDPDLHTATTKLEESVATGADQGLTEDIIPPIERLRRAARPRGRTHELPALNSRELE
jgi:hypothetical protein